MPFRPTIMVPLMTRVPNPPYRASNERAHYELRLFTPKGCDSMDDLIVEIISRGDNSEMERAEGVTLGYIFAKDLVRLGFALEAYTKEK